MPKVRPVMKSSLEPTEPFEITFPKLTKGLRLLKGMSWINYKTRAKQVPMVRKCEECEEFHPGLLTTNKDGTEHWKCYNCERIAAKAELAARKAERIEAMRRAFVGSMIMRNEYVLQQIGLTGKDPDGYTGQAFYKLSHRDRPRALAWAARKAGQVPPPEPKIIDPQDEEGRARQELARRELARRHLLPFIELFERDYKAGWVHKDICLRLEQFSDDVIAGRSPRLMLFLPPRAGKSLIASQYFPAWHFGRAAQHEIISASYAQSLQIDFSRKIQELLRTPEYRAIFPHTSVMKGNEALERWGISDSKGVRTGGGFLAAGVGGPITGRGAHVLNIDDPVKNREEADSAVTRASTKSWYSSTASTRLAPGGGVLIIQTRWHDDDLAGWILQGQAKAEKEYEETGIWPADAERWQVVSYPAIATADEPYRKRGEALHPERFPIGELLKKKRTMIPRDWAALYQQSPIVEEGAYFEKTMLRFYHGGHPEELDIYAAGDLAISKEDAACYTVLMVAGLDFDQKIYMLDERRGQWGADEIVEQIIDIIRVWKPLRFGIEKGQISMAIGPHLERRLREEKISFAVEEMPPTHRGNKEARARPLQGRMSRGEVLFPSGALWTDDHINELLRFPTGVYSDRVDADAWLAQILADVQYRGKKRGRGADKNWRSKLSGYTQKANSGRTSSMAS